MTGPDTPISPRRNRTRRAERLVQRLVRTFFNDSPSSAMAALLDATDGPLSDTEYKRLHALLKKAREQGGTR